MSAGLAASTVTPGRTAPEASRTVPVIDVCAKANAGTRTSIASTAAIRVNERINKTSMRHDNEDVRPARALTRGFRCLGTAPFFGAPHQNEVVLFGDEILYNVISP